MADIEHVSTGTKYEHKKLTFEVDCPDDLELEYEHKYRGAVRILKVRAYKVVGGKLAFEVHLRRLKPGVKKCPS